MLKAIVNGRILLPESEVLGKALLFDQKIIGIVDESVARAQAEEIIDAQGLYVAPGLVDTHIHGYQGADVSDADPDGVRCMAKGLLENGVTSFLPTSLTVAWETLETVCQQLRQLREESLSDDFEGAEILGMHMEGPFINPSKKGAQNEAYIQPMDPEKVLPHADIIKVLTCAPEMPNGDHFVRVLKDKTDIKLSIGHTGANYDQAMAAFNQGITRSTHTFNAMTPMMHRDPGVVGAALTSDVYCELIPDTFHVNKGLFPLMAKVKGNKLVLITDALRSAGMPDGEYENGGQIFILKGIECRLQDGTIAGSVLRFNHGVRNLRDYASLPLHQAVRAASLNPAESAGVADRKGSLTPGKDADIILMDAACEVHKTIVRGVCKFSK
ncbi:MAG: N-acetylglucosamine-6-phosphate deacetylase [Clostridiales bacterium]|nr:N-acetylglucosamine-6-phosphate deacetylase [Clostridiales bacterium]